MKATIDKSGILTVEATNDLESYALRKWAEEAMLFDEQDSIVVWKSEKLIVKGHDDE